MQNKQQSVRESQIPIFCDNCPILALAKFAKSILCVNCLLAEASRVGADASAHMVRPLDVV